MVDRENFAFESHGLTCRGWFYPAQNESLDNTAGVPAVIMAHGIGGTCDAGLEAYAIQFSKAGFAVLTFDYRYFGMSDGEPRQILSIRAQLADWRHAIAALQAIPGIDDSRIGLWGTSLAASHVVTLAARDQRIAAIAAQAPILDGRALLQQLYHRMGWWYTLRLNTLGLWDHITDMAGADPHWVPIIANHNKLALIAGTQAYLGYSSIIPDEWHNAITPRCLLPLTFYRPAQRLPQLHQPTLLQFCTHDDLAPPETLGQLLTQAGPNVMARYYHLNHFDIYHGTGFKQACVDQIRFFHYYLGVAHTQS